MRRSRVRWCVKMRKWIFLFLISHTSLHVVGGEKIFDRSSPHQPVAFWQIKNVCNLSIHVSFWIISCWSLIELITVKSGLNSIFPCNSLALPIDECVFSLVSIQYFNWNIVGEWNQKRYISTNNFCWNLNISMTSWKF